MNIVAIYQILLIFYCMMSFFLHLANEQLVILKDKIILIEVGNNNKLKKTER